MAGSLTYWINYGINNRVATTGSLLPVMKKNSQLKDDEDTGRFALKGYYAASETNETAFYT